MSLVPERDQYKNSNLKKKPEKKPVGDLPAIDPGYVPGYRPLYPEAPKSSAVVPPNPDSGVGYESPAEL